MRGIHPDMIIPAAQALYNGNIRLIEVTFDQASANCERETAKAIASLYRHFGDKLLVGAGTVMNTSQVEAAVNAGAKYIISPNTDIEVIKKTVSMKAVSIPGALSPTEIAMAYSAGADFVKIFPAGEFGIGYFKAVKAPLNHIPLIAVGGIDENNMNDFFAAGAAGIGVGSNIVNKKLINEGKFKELALLARKYQERIYE